MNDRMSEYFILFSVAKNLLPNTSVARNTAANSQNCCAAKTAQCDKVIMMAVRATRCADSSTDEFSGGRHSCDCSNGDIHCTGARRHRTTSCYGIRLSIGQHYMYSSLFTISGSQYRKTNANKPLIRYTDRQTDSKTQANSRSIYKVTGKVHTRQ